MRSTSVETSAEDGAVLRGVRWPGEPACVVLIHDLGQDLDAWHPLEGVLDETNCSRLAIDLRGHGLSEGTHDPTASQPTLKLPSGWPKAAEPRHLRDLGRPRRTRGSRYQPDAPLCGHSAPFTRTARSGGPRFPSRSGQSEALHLGVGRSGTRRRHAGASSSVDRLELRRQLPYVTPGLRFVLGPYATHTKEHIASFVHEFAAELPSAPTEVRDGRLQDS